jgi:hypothetical protein
VTDGERIFPRLLVSRVPVERLEICASLEVAGEDDPEFRPGSLVPVGDWTHVSGEGRSGEQPWVGFDDGATLDHNVALLRLPPEMSEGHLLREAEWSETPEQRRDLQSRVDQVCRLLTSTPRELRHNGTFRGVRGERTGCTTRHPDDRRLVGLHVDTVENAPVATLQHTLSRFCLNLGPNRRWFVFLPLDVSTVVNTCELAENDVPRSRHFRDTAMQRAPHAAWRIALEPGEGYIAPTQIMLHDGASASRDGEYLYTVLGHFDRTAQARSLSIL